MKHFNGDGQFVCKANMDKQWSRNFLSSPEFFHPVENHFLKSSFVFLPSWELFLWGDFFLASREFLQWVENYFSESIVFSPVRILFDRVKNFFCDTREYPTSLAVISAKMIILQLFFIKQYGVRQWFCKSSWTLVSLETKDGGSTPNIFFYILNWQLQKLYTVTV